MIEVMFPLLLFYSIGLVKYKTLILVFGLPGSGKSYFASHLAKLRSSIWLNSDRIRKEMFPTPSYTQQEKEKVYQRLFTLMAEHLKHSDEIILDATFYRQALREKVQAKGEELGCRCYWIEIFADETISRERLERPRPFSDADYGIFTKIKTSFEPMKAHHLRIQSSSDNLEEMLDTVQNYLKHEA